MTNYFQICPDKGLHRLGVWQAACQHLNLAANALRALLQPILFALLLLSGPAWAAVSTTTELSTSANPALEGQTVDFSVKVLPSTATGTITLYADEVPLAIGELSVGGTAGLSTSISLSSFKNTAAVEEQVSITVNVSPSTATGTVIRSSNGVPLASCTLSSDSATIGDTAVVAGTYPLQASYVGDNTHAPSASNVQNQEFKAAGQATTITLVAAPSPTTVGASTTLTATVTPNTATGTVTFKDGTTILGRLQSKKLGVGQ